MTEEQPREDYLAEKASRLVKRAYNSGWLEGHRSAVAEVAEVVSHARDLEEAISDWLRDQQFE